MSKIFVSYRRKSWGFTYRLAEALEQRLTADIFVDFEGIDEDNFEQSILRNLQECNLVLLIVTEHTFADRIHKDDDWVRREIRTALEYNIPLVLVAVDGLFPPSGLPQDIQDVARKQGIEFYPQYFSAAVERLAKFVVTLGASEFRTRQPVTAPIIEDEETITGGASLDEALDLLEIGDFAQAVFLLETLRDQQYKAQFIDLDGLLAQAQSHQAQAERFRLAKLGYAEVVMLAKRKFTLAQAQDAWRQWSAEYADLIAELDTENLHAKLQKQPVSATPQKKQSTPKASFSLPQPFDWIDIPAGQVTLTHTGGYLKEATTFDVPAFQIAKYPITYAQYELFVNSDGYQNKNYWSPAGWEWKGDKITPRYWQDEKWHVADHPVNGVSWYEAYAFTQWLSAQTGDKITLPTEQQWQRTAQGDDGREYPWGNGFAKERCNTDESGIGKTTPVTQYPQGASPFGVMDMSGNVWEWCLTDFKTGSVDIDNTNSRILRGGSFGRRSDAAACAGRNYFSPDYWFVSYGFRVVCGPLS